MARTGAFLVATFAVLLGGGLGVVGAMLMLDAGAFATGSSHASNGLFGLGASESQSASVPTAPWVGLLLAVAGFGLVGFGLRGMVESAD